MCSFPAKNTWSAQTLAQVKHWIAYCQPNHGSQVHQCPIKSGSFRPTCLLDVGSDDESPVVYLCNADSLPEHGSDIDYATLSHSGEVVYRKTRQNIDQGVLARNPAHSLTEDLSRRHSRHTQNWCELPLDRCSVHHSRFARRLRVVKNGRNICQILPKPRCHGLC